MAKALLVQSGVRRGLFEGLFRQPAWDMLLALYVALHEGVELTEAAVCAHSGESLPNARRWLHKMEQDGLVRRRGVPGDATAIVVVIAEGAALRLRHLLEDLVSG